MGWMWCDTEIYLYQLVFKLGKNKENMLFKYDRRAKLYKSVNCLKEINTRLNSPISTVKVILRKFKTGVVFILHTGSGDDKISLTPC